MRNLSNYRFSLTREPQFDRHGESDVKFIGHQHPRAANVNGFHKAGLTKQTTIKPTPALAL